MLQRIGTLSIETVVDLDADVLLLPIGDKEAADEIGLEATLAETGTKIVYIDFREHILKNTEPSLEVLGKLFGHEERFPDGRLAVIGRLQAISILRLAYHRTPLLKS